MTHPRFAERIEWVLSARIEEEDPLAAARGCLYGIVIGAAVWTGALVLAWLILS